MCAACELQLLGFMFFLFLLLEVFFVVVGYASFAFYLLLVALFFYTVYRARARGRTGT